LRALCELIRGVPLISLLFMAERQLHAVHADESHRQLLGPTIAFVLYAGAYLAEVMRGRQAVPRGQHEAADASARTAEKRLDHLAAIRHVRSRHL